MLIKSLKSVHSGFTQHHLSLYSIRVPLVLLVLLALLDPVVLL